MSHSTGPHDDHTSNVVVIAQLNKLAGVYLGSGGYDEDAYWNMSQTYDGLPPQAHHARTQWEQRDYGLNGYSGAEYYETWKTVKKARMLHEFILAVHAHDKEQRDAGRLTYYSSPLAYNAQTGDRDQIWWTNHDALAGQLTAKSRQAREGKVKFDEGQLHQLTDAARNVYQGYTTQEEMDQIHEACIHWFLQRDTTKF